MSDARAVAGRFALGGDVRSVMSLPGGHINDSFRVDLAGNEEGPSFLLQRLNPHVFPRPDHVMENVARVTRHIARQGGPTLTLMPTTDGRDWLVDGVGGVWRLFRWIPDSVVRVRAQSPAECHACGKAFGEFLRLVGNYEGPPLHETIPGFHDTRRRFGQFDAAIGRAASNRLADAQAEVTALLGERAVAEVLPPRFASGALPVRIVHNDAKIANVLFDRSSDAVLCVVDLDTVMPGSPLADFGDLVRSCVSAAAEDERDVSNVVADGARFEALARGFLEGSGNLLSPAERELLVFAGRWITLEQAVRFLTDYLGGDRYYRVSYPDHNLVRARAQLALYRSLTDQEPALARSVARF
ncbi:MAG TPA: aminoglycoside phosphotransferase family protein [Gemmatimonadales bacterium]